MVEKLVDGLTLEERLEGLEQGFHDNRLEGNPLTRAEKDQLRGWVRQGLSDDEISRLISADFIQGKAE
jgi:hypothetical protein